MAQEGRARVVFVSYAHEDDDLRLRLEVVLKPLVRSKTLEIWADDRIGVSRVWNEEIEASLERAEVAVLLISADFLASDYIMDVELPRLIARGVPLVCVPVGRVLYTTRDASALAAIGAAAQPVDVLSQAASVAFLEQALGPVAAGDRAAVETAIAQTGGVILALSLVAATVRAGASWAEVTSRLEALAQVYGEHPYADVFKPMRIAVDRLSPLDADRYYLLGVFPEDVAVPHATVGRLWGVDDPGPILARLADAAC